MKPIRRSLLVVVALLATIRAASPLTMTVVLGHSMDPTLQAGALYVLDRGYYRSNALERGDIVVLRVDGETCIKRVCALPGDRMWLLQYDDGSGDELLQPRDAGRLRQMHAAGQLPGRRVHSLTVPPDDCFVLGDNIDVSVDSR